MRDYTRDTLIGLQGSLASTKILQLSLRLAQWHMCQPHTNNYLALTRLATLVAYISSRVKAPCMSLWSYGRWYIVKMVDYVNYLLGKTACACGF